MVVVLPVVLGALYDILLNPAETPYLQGLAAVAVSGIGSASAAVCVIQALADCQRHANPRDDIPSMIALLRHFDRQAIAALPSVFSVLDELSPHSGPLALAATNAAVSSRVISPHIDGVWDILASVEVDARVRLEPRTNDFDFDPWFEWRLMYDADGSIFCGQDGLEFRLTCYHLPRPVPRVARSLDLCRPGTKTLVVFSRTPSLPACLPYELSYHYCSNIRSVDVYGRTVPKILKTRNLNTGHLSHCPSGILSGFVPRSASPSPGPSRRRVKPQLSGSHPVHAFVHTSFDHEDSTPHPTLPLAKVVPNLR
ncbi:hypothetical protein FRC10_005516 [Ceratobasidium sp. 414]|nr:hypothetical protein FRC10_005516 [Ceratobasidium sp. 414]